MKGEHLAVAALMVPALFYVAQGINYYASQGRVGMAIALTAYAVANCGLLMDFYGV